MRSFAILCLVLSWAAGEKNESHGQDLHSVNPHGVMDELDCSDCHQNANWLPLRDSLLFDHNAETQFLLVASHVSVSCAECHTDLVFSAPAVANDACATCHADPHAGTLAATCVSCHSETGFFDVDGQAIHWDTSFPLTGGHEAVLCQSCHEDDLGGAFSPLETECLACHASDYQEVHAGSGIPTTCLACHSDQTWRGAVFDHAARSNGFALAGAHEPLACESCHAGTDLQLIFSPPPAGNDDCVTCHQPDYDAEHAGSGFPLTCLSCHTDQTWDDAVFDHTAQSNGFDLAGAHEPLACESCHAGTDLRLIFSPPPAGNDDCVTCHQSDYNAEHAGSGFPLTCLTCHTDQNWDGAPFTQHDALYFPIYSGEHQGEWNSCVDCHTAAPFELVTFSCLTCHEHNQADMDDEHRGVSGYVYVSNACLSCHPNGEDD